MEHTVSSQTSNPAVPPAEGPPPPGVAKGLLGELLLARGHITKAQLNHSLEVQREYPKLRIGEILVKLRYLDPEVLRMILEERQDSMRLGEILLFQKVITQDQLSEALDFQGQQGARIGEALIFLGFCSVDQVQEALRQQWTAGRQNS